MADVKTDTQVDLLEKLLGSMGMSSAAVGHKPMVQSALTKVEEKVPAEDRFLSALAALVNNVDNSQKRFDKGKVGELVAHIDQLVNDQMNEILHHPDFQKVESAWRGLDDLVAHTNFKANIAIDLLDVGKDELFQDFENNSSNIFGSALFNKVYIAEYDQYGGRPFGAMIGQYEFSNTPDEIFWLEQMAKIANAAHAPFIASVSPKFFGCDSVEGVEAIKDLVGLMGQPKYGRWNKFRDTEVAAYVGLTFPRYVLRLPWHPEKNPCNKVNFTESADGDSSKYLWGNSAILFARNMVRSFEGSGWCQYLRGPKGGGMIAGLPVDTFEMREKPGIEEMTAPVEIAIPDYRELEFAKCGFVPLIYRKASADAAFFSVQSVKSPKRFKNPKDSENSQLVTNLSYTFSVTRIAHYVKSIMRDNIGTTADEAYIKKTLEAWLMQYVTTVVNPDDLTLRYYPFKAATVDVKSRPGEIGWYDCSVAVLPHLQFEGMNVELRLESRLGAKG